MRYRLRTLLILLAFGPPLLAGAYRKYSAWRAERERLAQRIYWMVSSPMSPEGYAQLPRTVGELEAQKLPFASASTLLTNQDKKAR